MFYRIGRLIVVYVSRMVVCDFCVAVEMVVGLVLVINGVLFLVGMWKLLVIGFMNRLVMNFVISIVVSI